MPHSYSYIVVIVNACPTEVSFASPSLQARTLQLHPVQVNHSRVGVKAVSFILFLSSSSYLLAEFISLEVASNV